MIEQNHVLEFASNELKSYVNTLKNDEFGYDDIDIAILTTTKPRSKNNIPCYVDLRIPNKLMKFFTWKETSDKEGYKYILVFDKDLIEKCNNNFDSIRNLIWHELKHIYIDENADRPFKIRCHDVEVFNEELTTKQLDKFVSLNKDNNEDE